MKGSTRADADDEAYPAGWAAPGDGYTLFEEFRGFALAEGPVVLRINKAMPEKKHQRLDPNARDVIIALESERPEDEAPLLQGAATFGQISGVTLRYVPRPSALGKRESDADAMHPRQADFRKTGDRELFGDAVAIWVSSALKDKNPSPAHAQSIHPVEGTDDLIGWPGDISAVYVSRKNAVDLVQAEAWFVDPLTDDDGARYKAAQAVVAAEKKKDPSFDPAKSAAYARVSPDALAEHVMAMNVVHELGHTLGAYHHEPQQTLGDVACPMRYWHIDDWQDVVAFVRRKWDLSTAPTGGAWKWCADNLPQLRLRSK